MELVAQLVARRTDMRLLRAQDGLRGIALARAHLPDVILMDINLPGISGLQALGLLRDDPATRHIPVLALSANAMPRDIERGMEAGFYRYLTKPIKINEFMQALEQALAMVPDAVSPPIRQSTNGSRRENAEADSLQTTATTTQRPPHD
jgi:CheY-like chemotaxis protein